MASTPHTTTRTTTPRPKQASTPHLPATALPPRPPTESTDAEPQNRPTPPSSTTAIPPTCFPSPTSVAHVVPPAPKTAPPNVRAAAASIAAMRPNPNAHNHSQPPQPAKKCAPDQNSSSRDHQLSFSPLDHHTTSNSGKHDLTAPRKPTSDPDAALASTPPAPPSLDQTEAPSCSRQFAPNQASPANVLSNQQHPHSSPQAYAPVPSTHRSESTSNSNHSDVHTSAVQTEQHDPQAVCATTPDASQPGTSPNSKATHEPPAVDKPDRDYYYRPDLVNTAPSQPLQMVSKAQFQTVLLRFIDEDPATCECDEAVLANKIRNLLDHLDALVEQLALRLTNSLFDALSHPKCLAMLIFLLSDISARSAPDMTDVRKSYRYPYIVSNILANGSMGIREAFMSSACLVNYLLSFLDGAVVLSTGKNDGKTLEVASQNAIIVGNVIQILTSYMETSPDTLLAYFESRATFVPSLVNLLHIGSMPKLLSSIIPDRCVDDVGRMDPSSVSFDTTMTKALNVLAGGHVLHYLSNAFTQATQSVYSIMTQHPEEHEELQQAQQLAYNSVEVYGEIIKKSIRAGRVNSSDPACQYLSIYATVSSAETLAQILTMGIELFRGTNNLEISSLIAALDLTVSVVKLVEEDREKRVASITGQPPPLDVSALERILQPLLRSLMSILLDIVFTGSRHGRLRLRILELFVECQRVFSESTLVVIDKLRFGEVVMKLMQLHSRNSLLQYIVCRAVETGLVYNTDSVTAARHWLVRSRLVERTITAWHTERGDDNWFEPLIAQQRPNLSTLVHIACCITHWMAIQRHGSTAGVVDAVEAYLPVEVIVQFESFFEKSIQKIMQFESSELCGPKPRRGPARSQGGSLGRSFGNFGDTSAALLRRSSSAGSTKGVARLVRSASAHRFGYVAPSTASRSRFDELFSDDSSGDRASEGGRREGVETEASVIDGSGFGRQSGSISSAGNGSRGGLGSRRAGSFLSIFDMPAD